MPTPAIILKNVSAQLYGKTVLDDISFEITARVSILQ